MRPLRPLTLIFSLALTANAAAAPPRVVAANPSNPIDVLGELHSMGLDYIADHGSELANREWRTLTAIALGGDYLGSRNADEWPDCQTTKESGERAATILGLEAENLLACRAGGFVVDVGGIEAFKGGFVVDINGIEAFKASSSAASGDIQAVIRSSELSVVQAQYVLEILATTAQFAGDPDKLAQLAAELGRRLTFIEDDALARLGTDAGVVLAAASTARYALVYWATESAKSQSVWVLLKAGGPGGKPSICWSCAVESQVLGAVAGFPAGPWGSVFDGIVAGTIRFLND